MMDAERERELEKKTRIAYLIEVAARLKTDRRDERGIECKDDESDGSR